MLAFLIICIQKIEIIRLKHMHKLIFNSGSALFLMILLLSCSDQETIEREMSSGLKEKYTISAETNKKTGAYRLYYSDGAIFEESQYENDTLHGPRKLYYEDGGIEILENYEKGIIEGPYKMYYPSGQVKVEGTYNKGVMDSTWTAYYPSGAIKEKVNYEDNFEQGPFIEYYESGNLKAKGQYLRGDNEDGILYLYDSTGTEKRVMECDSGICRTIWTPDSSFAIPN